MFLSVDNFAQQNFTGGYVILANGDTLRGYLQEEVEGSLVTGVTFSNNENGTSSKKYVVTDAKAFHYDQGSSFEAVSYNDLNNTPTTTFAKLLLTGYYRLYSLRIKDVIFFVVKNNDSTQLLYDDIRRTDGTIETTGNYVNVLSFLSRTCDKLKNEVTRLRYAEPEMLSFVSRLNQCISPDETNTSFYLKPHSTATVYLYAGGLPLGDEYELIGRVGAKITTPSISKNLSLGIAFTYSTHKQIDSYEQNGSSYITTFEYNHILKLQTLSGSFQYDFATGRLRPYFQAGIGLTFSQEQDPINHGGVEKFENDFGASFLAAIGVEGYVTKHLAIKADWRYEVLFHYPTIGVAYFF
jgi:hypothetical protein